MTTINPNAPAELPSSRTLLRSTLIALAVATALLVTVVLPANMPSTRPASVARSASRRWARSRCRLRRKPRPLMRPAALLEEGAAAPAVAESAQAMAAVTDSAAPSSRSDVTTITLRPNEGKEVKLEMREGASATYAWSVEGGVVNYDTHGDPYDAPSEFYHGYGKGTAVSGHEGQLVAAFDGLHGWFWRNRTGSTVTVSCERKALTRVYAGPDSERQP